MQITYFVSSLSLILLTLAFIPLSSLTNRSCENFILWELLTGVGFLTFTSSLSINQFEELEHRSSFLLSSKYLFSSFLASSCLFYFLEIRYYFLDSGGLDFGRFLTLFSGVCGEVGVSLGF